MNRDQLIEHVQQQMPKKRWQHTFGTMQSAVELARRFGGDPDKAELAALLHDYCKYWPVERQAEVLREKGAQKDLFEYESNIWHGPAAAEAVRDELGITDEEVLDAVRWHTSGRETMTLLDKIVCLADYIEPGRDFPDVHKIRKLAKHSLEEALLAGFDTTISFLLEKKAKIYPLSVFSRNSLINEINRKQNIKG